MKIFLNKYEYAHLIRGCKYCRDRMNCNSCALTNVCSGEGWLEDMVEVVPIAPMTEGMEYVDN